LDENVIVCAKIRQRLINKYMEELSQIKNYDKEVEKIPIGDGLFYNQTKYISINEITRNKYCYTNSFPLKFNQILSGFLINRLKDNFDFDDNLFTNTPSLKYKKFKESLNISSDYYNLLHKKLSKVNYKIHLNPAQRSEGARAGLPRSGWENSLYKNGVKSSSSHLFYIKDGVYSTITTLYNLHLSLTHSTTKVGCNINNSPSSDLGRRKAAEGSLKNSKINSDEL
jgi:hypothetical protein